MGCDGGTIPTRDELVRKKKKEEKISKEDDLNTKWRNCAISQAPLEKPIVSCQLGKLFSKESLLEFLIAKTAHPSYDTYFYIKHLKDVKDIKLTDNPAYKAGVNMVGATQGAPFICPIIGLEMNGNYKFLYLITCGCVMSERALREIKGEHCPGCNAAFTSADVIMLNGSEEEVEELRKRMESRKVNKKKRKIVITEATATNKEDGLGEFKVPKVSSSKPASSKAESSKASSSKASLSKAAPISSPEIVKDVEGSVRNSKDGFKKCKTHLSSVVV